MKLIVENLALERGGRRVLAGLSFEARAGEFIDVRGRNGAGKTSLLRALAGWLRPAEGRIRFEGEFEPATSMHVLGHRDGVKSGISLIAHVRYWAGLFGADPAGSEAALERVGLARIAKLPARVLSAGQSRRLALSRLIVAPRPIWLLDEPLASLDEAGRTMVAELAAEHLKSGIVVAAGHDPLGVPPASVVTL
ncbi:MAG: heme ABC exporter ATP-binding protein CcmA [Hyphomonadaceae bacterium]|nr:heme ABC exporter ATP-binding protein CcmA [Hyphomonadaceae bacterium]